MNKYLKLSLSIAIILVFGYTLFHESLNLPSFDDYDATLLFIKHFYFENKSINDRIDLLLVRHNEHRILLSKAVSSIYFKFFGEISFKNLVILQNLFLVGFFGVIAVLFRQQKQLNADTFLLLVTLLFSFSFWQVSFYYWGGIQHYTVFFFSFLSLFVLNKTNKILSLKFVSAVFAAIFAVFSFGNGFLVLLAGAFLLFSRQKYPVFLAWLAVCGPLLFITFFVQRYSHAESAVSFNVEWMARLLFTFLGSFLYVNPFSLQYVNILICMVAGAAILVFWVWLIFSGYAFRKPLLYALFSLPVLTGIIISISRFETKAAGGIAPRYMFFTTTIPVMLLLILLDMKILKPKMLSYLGFFAVLLWTAGFYHNVNALKLSNNEIAATIQKWTVSHDVPLVYYHDADHYSTILDWAFDQKVVNNRMYDQGMLNLKE